MDELIRQGQWWWLLIPLGTGVFALLGSWLGAKLGSRNEHKQWHRDKKFELYSDIMTELKPFGVGSSPIDREKMKQLIGAAVLVGDKKIWAPTTALEAAVDACHDHLSMCKAKLSMTKEDEDQYTVLTAKVAELVFDLVGKMRTDLKV